MTALDSAGSMPKVTIQGVNLAYEASGPADSTAPALVLVHGFPLDSRVWDGVSELTSKRWRTIRPDLRGFGQSRDATDTPFSIQSLAEDLHAMLRQLQALPAVVAGLSMGGYVALAFARLFPEDVAGLALVDTRASADDEAGRRKRDESAALVEREGVAPLVDQMHPNLLAEVTKRDRPEVARRLREIMLSCPAWAVRQASLAMRDRPDQRDLLPRLEMPAAVIVGEEDKITPPEVAREMASALSAATLTEIAGAGHLAPMEQPAAVAEALDRLMAQAASA